MLGKLGEFAFSGWGQIVGFVVGFSVLVGAWKLERYSFGERKEAAGARKERGAISKKANENVSKANRVRDRVSTGTGRLQPSPYVRR